MYIEYPKMKWSILKKDYVTFVSKEHWDSSDKSNFIDTKQYLDLIKNFPTNEDLVKFLTIEKAKKEGAIKTKSPEILIPIPKTVKKKNKKRNK